MKQCLILSHMILSSQDADEQKQVLRDEITVLKGEKKFLEETVQAQHASIQLLEMDVQHASHGPSPSLQDEILQLRSELASRDSSIKTLQARVNFYENVRDWVSASIQSGMPLDDFPDWFRVGGQRAAESRL